MSDARTIVAEPLTASAFAPFGDVITTGANGKSANQGTAARFDWTAKLESTRPGAKPNLAVFRAMPQPLPFHVKLLEHHPHSSQAFVPMVCARYLVVVAGTGADGKPDLNTLRAFIGAVGQGINYHRATWHHPIVALEAPADLAMLAWEDGSAGDCVEFAVTPAQIVRVD